MISMRANAMSGGYEVFHDISSARKLKCVGLPSSHHEVGTFFIERSRDSLKIVSGSSQHNNINIAQLTAQQRNRFLRSRLDSLRGQLAAG